MEKKKVKELLKKYGEGKCTASERALLEAWYLEYNEQAISPEQPENGRGRFNAGMLLAAAAISGILLWLVGHIVFDQSRLSNRQLAHGLRPRGDKALLTLADGKEIDLGEASTGPLAAQQGSRIVKNAAGQVIYLPGNQRDQGQSAGTNMITTPAGGTWEVHLPDGTKVWLNNASSLTYPATFRSRRERVVALAGEAYFEVAKDRDHPFIVKSGLQETRVLGTHFNINAFPEENGITTTLLEGCVTVGIAGSNLKKTLLPGKQSRLAGDHITITDADTDRALGWKNGYFRFDHTPVVQAMRELSRWYGIDVQYSGPVSDERLSGRISRFKDISKVLIALEATRTVHFKVEGRRVTVMK